jgi:hypothetical protein
MEAIISLYQTVRGRDFFIAAIVQPFNYPFDAVSGMPAEMESIYCLC